MDIDWSFRQTGAITSLVSALRAGARSCRGVWQSAGPLHPPPRLRPERRLRALLSHVPLPPDAEDHLDAAGEAGAEPKQAWVGAWSPPGD